MIDCALEVARQHDLWHRIVESAAGQAPGKLRLHDLPRFDQPAVTRYGATTPALLRCFRRWNAGKPYREQVKPYNFLLFFHPRPAVAGARAVRPVAPFDRDHQKASYQCFDRGTGLAVPPESLVSYAETLKLYHRHPESKFHNGDYVDSGMTTRRQVVASRVEIIGKEADRWEELVCLGPDPEAQIEYGEISGSVPRLSREAVEGYRVFGVREVADETGVNHAALSRVLRARTHPSEQLLGRLEVAVRRLDKRQEDFDARAKALLDLVRHTGNSVGVRTPGRSGPREPVPCTPRKAQAE
jgi:hypothetical protein